MDPGDDEQAAVSAAMSVNTRVMPFRAAARRPVARNLVAAPAARRMVGVSKRTSGGIGKPATSNDRGSVSPSGEPATSNRRDAEGLVFSSQENADADHQSEYVHRHADQRLHGS